jgi:ankyrin repeat protein
MPTKVDHKDAQSAQKFYSDCLHALTQNNTPSFFEFLNKYRSETSETLQNIFQSYQSEGKTFFHIAASTRNTDVIRYALENCSNASILVNTADEHGFTPLINATVGESSDIMKLLILHGANVNSQNNDGASALHFASGDGSIERMNILCDAGADVSLTSQAGSPLSWAAGNGRAEAVRFVLSNPHLQPIIYI